MGNRSRRQWDLPRARCDVSRRDRACERSRLLCFFFFQAEDGIRDLTVTGVQTCALPICLHRDPAPPSQVTVQTLGSVAAPAPAGVRAIAASNVATAAAARTCRGRL